MDEWSGANPEGAMNSNFFNNCFTAFMLVCEGGG